MVFTKLLRFIRGYVYIKATGPFLERFINLITLNGLCPWGLKKKDGQTVFLYLCVKDFKRLRKYSKKAKAEIHILKKYGLPFKLHRYRKRWGLFFGAVLFLAVVFLMSCFVWSVDISGNEEIPEREIISALEQCGFKEGVYKGNLNLRSIRQKMRVILPDVSFVELNIKGTKAYVKITEERKVPEILKKNEPCNIIAKRSGVIEKIETTAGIPLVQKGDIVEKGSLLVSGIIDSPKAGYFLVHSRANVFASNQYELQVFSPFKTVVYRRTGNFCEKKRLRLFNFYINLYFRGGIDYVIYDKIIRTDEAKIGDCVLPIALETQVYYEKEQHEQISTKEEAQNRSMLLLSQTARYEFENKQVLKKEEKISFSSSGCTAKGTYLVIENIAEELPIETERNLQIGTDS